ncbi:MAG: hypothetical protein R3E68_03400 [Burkholderiaceae bacterium]
MRVAIGDLVPLLCGPQGLTLADHVDDHGRCGACFTGAELVQLLVTQLGASRAHGVRLGQRLLDAGFIQRVRGGNVFADDKNCYAIASPGAGAGGHAAEGLSIDALRTLAARMAGRAGIPVDTHRRWLIDYPATFVAADAVSWLVARLAVSRAEATGIGRAMIRANLIRHVLDEHDFADGDWLYRFV